ncbi:MAG: 30S ribosome-binding factor RbfA [Desulfuromonadales bacterium]|nr:30S ribosome-binding factor RbfA [Desulfuromonadales bacterium]
MSSFRPERVGEQILKETSMLLMERIKDPRVATVTLTGVKVSRDLSLARIYFTLSDSDARKAAETGLKSAASFIRRELSQIMRLRFMPDIRFQFDESVSKGQRIDDLLRQVQGDLHDTE